MTPDGVAPPVAERLNRLARHVAFPALLPAIFFAVALSPVSVLGCRDRGLLALLVALASGCWAMRAAFAAAKERARDDSDALWWVISSIVLTVPVVAMIVMA